MYWTKNVAGILRNCFWQKALTPSLGPQINRKQEKSLTSLPPFCICVLCSESFFLQPPWNAERTGLIYSKTQRKLPPKKGTAIPPQDRPPVRQ
jgi:hypothetical protein